MNVGNDTFGLLPTAGSLRGAHTLGTPLRINYMMIARTPHPKALPLAALSGVLAAGMVLGVAELLGAFFTARATPVIALGQTFIDFTPGWLKDFAIDTFGTNDKLVLLISLGVAIVVLAAAAGVLAYRKWLWGAIAVVVLGAVIVACVISRAGATILDTAPSVAGTAAGLLALRWMIWRLRPATTAAGTTRTASERGTSAPTPTGNRPALNRRSFFVAAGTTATIAAVSAGAGRVLGGIRNTAGDFRRSLALPRPAITAPPLPDGVNAPIEGTVPFVTPNDRFYRIDTALTVPQIDAQSWELRVHGMVEEEFTIGFDELLNADLTEAIFTLTCVSNPVGGDLAGNAKWLGLPIRELLARAKPTAGADMVLSSSIDGYTAATPLQALTDDRDALLAIGMNGEPLPLEHGYPVRMVVPGLYGYTSATKWVVDLEVSTFAGNTSYWIDRGWATVAPIKTASRIEAPQSFEPLPAGTIPVGGTAWSQRRGITKVELQIDDGEWQETNLAAEGSIDMWRQWSFQWENAEPGNHYLRVRAYDGENGLQTQERAEPIPNGAAGWQSILVQVT